jgi:hypothetical protein
VESLEERTVPSILFGPQTALTVSDNGGPVLSQAPVRVVFWGPGWNSSDGLALRGQVINSINSLTASSGTYFASSLPGADLGQYRPGGLNSRPVIDNFYATSNLPPGVNFTANDVLNMLRNTSPFNTQPNFYYYVIPDPNSDPRPSCGCAAEHTFGTIGATTTHFGFSRNLPLGSAGQLDDLTILYSHEMVESITDPEGTALQVNPRNPTNWNEIADGEGQLYGYRLNGVWTQAYWSRDDNAFTVPTGQYQNFFVSGGAIPRVLTVNGGQLGGNDSITIDAVGNGVRVTLNGEVAQFEPGQIRSIVVNTGNGNDTINIERSLSGVPVTVNEQGSGTDVVNVSPSAQNLNNIQGTINVNGNSGTDSLVVTDQNNAVDSLTYSMIVNAVQRSGSAAINFSRMNFVTLYGGFSDTYLINGTGGLNQTTLNWGGGNNEINVLATTGALSINPNGTGRAQVRVGAAGSVQGLQGHLFVEALGTHATLIVEDWADTNARAPLLRAVNNTGFINNLAPAEIQYVFLDNVTVYGGSGVNTFTVSNTPSSIQFIQLFTGNGNDSVGVEQTTSPLGVILGTGNDTVNLSPTARNLNNIQGSVGVDGNAGVVTLVVNDQNNSAAQTYSLDARVIHRSGVEILSFVSMSTVTLNGGSGGNLFNVESTAAGTAVNINAGAGNDTVNVGNNGSLQNIQGRAITVTDPSGRLSITVDDRNDTISQAPVLSTNPADTTYGQITGLALGPIYYRYANTLLTVWTGTSTALVNVQATGTSTNVAANDAQGTTINVGNAGSAQQIQGALSLSNPAGPLMVNVNDQNDPAAQPGITLETVTQGPDFILLQNLAPAPIFSVANQTSAFVVNGGSGGNTFHVRGLLPGATLAIDGGSGNNTLDYTGYAGNVLVNLPLGAATGFSSIANIQNVTGASGGPAGSYNVLIGNGGNVLTGGNGRRNLLVAGASASTLIGGNDDDILIAGTTDYDIRADWQAAFTAIMNEWTQMTGYDVRVDHLLNGGGLNDPFLLNATTVHSNGGGNVLTGHGGGASELNLYFATLNDTTDCDPTLGEQCIPIV